MERKQSSRHGGSSGRESAGSPARRHTSHTPSQNLPTDINPRVASRLGGNHGQSASMHEQLQPSPASTQSVVHNISNRASLFLKEHEILKKIEDAIYNRGNYGKDFVPEKALCDIWHHYLKEFLNVLGITPYEEDLIYIWNNLLNILSILVVIRWKEWHRFSHIFLEPMRDPEPSRLDDSIPFPLDKLSDESFLGEMGPFFYSQQYTFKPIVVEEGKASDHPSWSRVPFIQIESEELGRGNYGVVTKEAIAPYQFKPKKAEHPNTVWHSLLLCSYR
jgi:hypothetical protein